MLKRVYELIKKEMEKIHQILAITFFVSLGVWFLAASIKLFIIL